MDPNLLTPVAGLLTQYLRGFRWFGEGATYLLAAVLASVAVWLANPGLTDPRAFVITTITPFLTFVGGVHMGGGIAKVASGTVAEKIAPPQFDGYVKEGESKP